MSWIGENAMLPELNEIKILLADDLPAMRAIVRGMLEDAGFTRITEAEDGELAWQLLQDANASDHGEFHLVIADWQMPRTSGAALLRSLRSSPGTREIPFLMITAKSDDASIREALRAGVTDYLVKPFQAEQLIGKITALFG
jgi:two-component system chemotaxis response regulator CheY